MGEDDYNPEIDESRDSEDSAECISRSIFSKMKVFRKIQYSRYPFFCLFYLNHNVLLLYVSKFDSDELDFCFFTNFKKYQKKPSHMPSNYF